MAIQTAVDSINNTTSGSPFGFKNRIINGAMAIAQRGTSFTSVGNSGSVPAYTLDRWFGWRGAWTANLDVSQQTGWGSYQYAMRVQRTSGTSSTASINIAQIIESINCYDLAGQNVTISLGMRSGANYSGGQVSVIAQFSTAENQTSSGLGNGTWTGQTGLSQNFTLTTTATSYSLTVAVPSNALSVALQINWTPTGTAGTNDYIEITGVQLEKGSVATAFDYRPYGTELQLCQRYYQMVVGTSGAGQTSTTCDFAIQFPQQMRAAPTCSQAGVVTVTDVAASDFTQSSTAFTSVDGPSAYGHHIRLSNFTGITIYRPLLWRNTNSTNNILLYSAEL